MKAIKRAVLAGLVLCLLSGGAPAGAQNLGRTLRYVYCEVEGLLPESPPPYYLLEPEEEVLHELLGRLEKARRDEQVDGLIIRVGGVLAGWGKVQELRRSLSECRAAGKDVICLLEGGGSLSYYLASAGDRIVLLPAGQLMLVGLRAEAIFAKGLLDKIGVKAEVVQAGQFKAAGEPLTRTEPSPAFRESLASILDDYYEQLLSGIAEGRAVSRERAVAFLSGGPYTTARALEDGLVDDVMFYDELRRDLADSHGARLLVKSDYGKRKRASPLAPGSMGLFNMLMGTPSARRPAAAGPAIAVIHAVGPILRGKAEGISLGEQAVWAENFVATVRKAVQERDVKAIVVRIDSPGGSARACDRIWRELRLADRKKPVIASLSDVAASGGYYLAAGARRIYAEPGTLTGSIGVVGMKLVVAELAARVGLNVFVMERGGQTGIPSMFSGFTPEERRAVEELIEETYRTFLERVAETRPDMSVQQVDAVAQGRVWTGAQARRRGLVDALGGMDAAVAAAREAAGIPPEQELNIVHMPEPRSLIEVLLTGEEGDPELRQPDLWAAALPEPLGRVRAYARALGAMGGEVSACLLPALITIR